MLHIIKIKGCKRCGGDLFLERDDDGVYIACLQCGAIYTRQGEEARRNITNIPSGLRISRHYQKRSRVYIESR